MYSNSTGGIIDTLKKVKHEIYDKKLHYAHTMLYANLDQYFTCGEYTYTYERSNKNLVYLSERVVELPIVVHEVKKCIGNHVKILEVGNVLSHLYDFEHDTVDKFEQAPNVINQDIMDYTPALQYDLIISISTVEHIGYDEPDKNPLKCLSAIRRMVKMTKAGGKVIITVPLGWNPYLDGYIKRGEIAFSNAYLMHKISEQNWQEEPLDLLKTRHFEYDAPYRYANWVLIITIDVV